MPKDKKKKDLSPMQRFTKSFRKGEGCWEWIRGLDRDGYGIFYVKNRRLRAHRVSYELFVGPIPKGLVICHSCDNPKCVRPSHLWPGTQQANMDDKVAKGRHVYGENHPSAILTEKDVLSISASEYTAGTLAAEYGVSIHAIHDIWNGARWAHLKVSKRDRRTRLSESEVLAIRKSNDIARVCALKYGVTTKTIHRIRNGETWSELPNERRDRRIRGEAHPDSKLTDEQAANILHSPYETNELQDMHGISRSVVQKIRRGDIWKHVSHD